MANIGEIEKKVVLGLEKLLSDEERPLKRLRLTGRVLAVLGWLSLTFMFIAIFETSSVHTYFLVLAVAGGVCIGLSIWLSTFSSQWPVLRAYIDVDRIKKRAKELNA